MPLTLSEETGFTGRSVQLGIGEHRLSDDFNHVAASIQGWPPGTWH
jgi:hypothetical protein